jgi:hypothetical protein
MNNIWQITIDDYIEAIELARSRGKVAGQSFEEEFLEIMEKKGKKSSGSTELSQDELLKEVTSHDKKVLSMETKDGKTLFKTIKEDELKNPFFDNNLDN